MSTNRIEYNLSFWPFICTDGDHTEDCFITELVVLFGKDCYQPQCYTRVSKGRVSLTEGLRFVFFKPRMSLKTFLCYHYGHCKSPACSFKVKKLTSWDFEAVTKLFLHWPLTHDGSEC